DEIRVMRLDIAQHLGFESAEGEFEIVPLFQRPGKRGEIPFSARGQPGHQRSGGVTQAQDFPAFVESLAGGIVPGLAYQGEAQARFHLDEFRMASRNHQAQEGWFQFRIFQEGRGQMPFQMVDAHDGLAQGAAQGAGEGSSHQERTQQSGPPGEGDLIDGIQYQLSFGQAQAYNGVDFFKMGPGRDFGYHSAILGMDRHLAVYLVGQNPHLGVHEAAGGFVARGFNPEGYHGTKITYGAARPNPTLHKPPELGENESNMSSSLFGKDDLLKTFQPLSESGKAYLEIQMINHKSGKAEGRGYFNYADFLLEACMSMEGRYNFSMVIFVLTQAHH